MRCRYFISAARNPDGELDEHETAKFVARQQRHGRCIGRQSTGIRRAGVGASANPPAKWQQDADVVVIGSGATGLPAAIVAREAGASVILVEAEKDIGGHAITSGGNVPLGGGTSAQKKYDISDSPDLLFRDLTDWSVVEPNGFPDYRYNDREIIRGFADNSAATFEWLVAHGVVFVDKAPDAFGGTSVGNSVPREMHSAVMDWPMVQTGKPADPMIQKTLSSGNGLMRPLQAAAKKAGVQILLEHKMTAIFREQPSSGSVLGIAVDNRGKTINIRAHKAVIIATGGSTGNVNFRRIFDPRLTEEYCGLSGMPWSNQDASGELAGMAVGASLWGATIRPANSAPISLSRARSAASTTTSICAGCRPARYSIARALPAWRLLIGRT